MKKRIWLMAVTAAMVMMTLIGCPPAGQGGQTQVKAASGLKNDLSVKGEIDGTYCEIKLNAADGTFTATETPFSVDVSLTSSSRGDVTTFSGEFFYYDGKLQLKVTAKNEQDLTDDAICLTAEVAPTQLTQSSEVTFQAEQSLDYEAAKVLFRQANPITSSKLAGRRYVCDEFNISMTMTMNGTDTTGDSTAEAVFDFTENSILTNFFSDGKGVLALPYTISGNTITINVDVNSTLSTTVTDKVYEYRVNMTGTLTGKLSDNLQQLSISGNVTQNTESVNTTELMTMTTSVTYSGTFNRQTSITDLTGKTYKANIAKIGGQQTTLNPPIKLSFTKQYQYQLTQGDNSIHFIDIPMFYFAGGGKISITSSFKIDGATYSGQMTGTISSDLRTITIKCNLQTVKDGEILLAPFEWTFVQD